MAGHAEASSIGRVVSLYRYPVKSMAGEALRAAEVTPVGLLGDRAYALIDRNTGRVVSAKRPRLWGDLLGYRAVFTEPPALGGEVPAVQITLPDGRTGSSADTGAVDRLLSEVLGRRVRLAGIPPVEARFEYHWPDMAGLQYEGRTYRDEITEHELPPGTFFDSAAVHLLTTSSVKHLQALVASSRVDVRRFRPNVVIDVGEAGGFVEDGWVGRTLRIGDAVRIRVTKPCLRCVMVNLSQRGLDEDQRVLKAAFEHNDGTVGVQGSVARAGPMAVGDAVRIE